MTTPDQRATDLLHSILSPQEARCLKVAGFVEVRAKSGRCYRVSAHDVYEMDGIERVAHFCILPKIAGIPESDKLLAKYLLIKGNEELFLRLANKTGTVQGGMTWSGESVGWTPFVWNQ